jgi:hypothetical protein
MKINWNKYFIRFAAICLGLQILGAVVSIAFSMPAQVVFGGSVLLPTNATPGLVAQEFLTKGTALAPPLLLTVIFCACLYLSMRKGALRVVGIILLIIIGILFTFATSGEYINPDRFPQMPGPIFLVNLVINNIFTIGISILGIFTLISQTLQKEKNKTFQQ